MTFDWQIVILYLGAGRSVRHKDWESGKYLSLHRGRIVDQDCNKIENGIINIYTKKIYWTRYLELYHGVHRCLDVG